jgi:hypothetical protein
MGSKQTGESTTTNKVDFPQYVQDAQQASLGLAAGMSAPWMTPQDSRIAGFTEDQLMAQDLARQTAQGGYGTDYSGNVRDAAFAGRDAINNTAQSNYANASGNADAVRAAGQGITGADIQSMMNPYLDDVGKTTLDNMRREYQNAQAGLDAKYANESAFGGSGAALARASQARGYNQDVGSTIAQLRAGGFDRGADLAKFNSSQKLAAEQAAAGLGANAGQNLMSGVQAGAAMGMAGATGANSAYNDTFARQLEANKLLSQQGAIQQNFAQSGLDMPYNQLDWLRQYIPGVVPNSSSSQPIYSNPLGTIAGLGMSLL